MLRTTRTLTGHLTALLTIAAMVVACGGETTDDDGSGPIEPDPAEGEAGTMHAYATDDPSSSNASSGSAGSASDFSGTLTGSADVEVSENGSTWYVLGPNQDFAVPLQNGAEQVELAAPREIPAGTYRFVRINFFGVEANLDAGSVVDGETLPDDVHLRMGDSQSAVFSGEADPFELEVGASGRIVLDLNSQGWVTAENVSKRQFAKSEFEAAATASIVSD